MTKSNTKIFTVGEVSTLIKVAIADRVPSRLVVCGQVSGWRAYGSGHCYFSLKDSGGVLPCVMWKSSRKNLKFDPTDGVEVYATGYIDVYPPQGKYQFYVERMRPAGVGDLQLEFEQMVARLTKEGLFGDEHKQQLPRYPQRIGVVTSEAGAAVHDIADSIHNRWPCAELMLYPVRVQGDGAGLEIATAIRQINSQNDELGIDVLIVGRGGGSIEDLWAFNEEVVARAIFASRVPVISAVGHEVDTTIADLVADARASTPTKAGVIAVPDAGEVAQRLDDAAGRLRMRAESKLELCGQKLATAGAHAVFSNPMWIVNSGCQRVDEGAARLSAATGAMVSGLRRQVDGLCGQLGRIEPHRLIGQKKVELNDVRSRLEGKIQGLISKKRLHLAASENRLGALNPKSVLGRGYSITVNKSSGKVVQDVGDVSVDDEIVTELAGEKFIESQVKKVE